MCININFYILFSKKHNIFFIYIINYKYNLIIQLKKIINKIINLKNNIFIFI